MKKQSKHLLWGGTIAAGLIGTVVLVYTSAVKLMTLALDRQEPKLIQRGKKRISGSQQFAEIGNLLAEAGRELAHQNPDWIHIKGEDQVELVGHWLCPKEPKRIIIAMHGWRSSWNRDFGIIAPFWLENDCAILFAEQRGQGKSGGDYMGFGLLERHDCALWIQWVLDHTKEQLPIYLGGISMGASTILMAAGSPLPKQVRGIIADCGFTSPKAIWKHVAEQNLHLPFRLYHPLAGDICRRKLHVDLEEYSCPEAMKHCKIPVLFIHGTDDRFVPIEMTFENYKACNAPKRIFIVPGADHGMSYLVDREGYENAILAFWNELEAINEKED